MKSIILGSVQFGMKYGINNIDQRVELSEIKSILNFARDSQIDTIDTAISYNESEQVLGNIGLESFKVISKLPKLPDDVQDVNTWVKDQAMLSINRLKVKSLHGLLLHCPSDLIGSKGPKLKKALNNLKTSNLVYKIGVSIYDPEELDNIFPIMKIDIVQCPLNLIDRRLETSGWLSRLYKENIEVHVRSIFLQGLLLMGRNKIPSKFKKWSNIWDLWSYKLNSKGFNALDACLSYPLSLKEVNCIIVGVDNTKQLKDIIYASKKKIAKEDWSFMISNNKMLINPSNWRDL